MGLKRQITSQTSMVIISPQTQTTKNITQQPVKDETKIVDKAIDQLQAKSSQTTEITSQVKAEQAPITPKSISIFSSISKTVAKGINLATKIQPKMNQMAKNTGSVMNFIKDAAITGVGVGATAAGGAFLNTIALGVATAKSLMDLNAANTTISTNKEELASLKDNLSKAETTEQKEALNSKIETQEKKLNKSKKKRGTKAVDLATKTSLFTGSLTGTIGGIATVAAQVGSAAAPAIGAVATGAALSAIAPAGLLIGGTAMLGVNAYKGVKNVGKLNTAKKEVANLKEELKSAAPEQKADIKKKLIDAEAKVDKFQGKWNANKKNMVVGAGLTIAGGAMAAATITGVGAPIAVAVGLAIAAVGIGSSGQTPKILQSPLKTIKQTMGLEKKDPPSFDDSFNASMKKCESSNDPKSLEQKNQLNALKEELPTLTKDEAKEKLETIMSGEKNTFIGETKNPLIEN